MIRAVSFDLFDTLVDLFMENLPEITVGGQTIRSTYGLLHEVVAPHAEIGFEEFAGTLRAVDRDVWKVRGDQGLEFPTRERFALLLERLGLERPGLAEELVGVHMGHIRAQARHLPHHAEVLARLRAAGLRVAVCSNFSHSPTALEVLDAAGLRTHLDCVVISEEVGIRKPRPEIFRETLRRLGTAAEETAHVGDRLDADVAGAAPLGIRSVWLTRRARAPETQLAEYAGPAPDHIVGDLAELPELIAAL